MRSVCYAERSGCITRKTANVCSTGHADAVELITCGFSIHIYLSSIAIINCSRTGVVSDKSADMTAYVARGNVTNEYTVGKSYVRVVITLAEDTTDMHTSAIVCRIASVVCKVVYEESLSSLHTDETTDLSVSSGRSCSVNNVTTVICRLTVVTLLNREVTPPVFACKATYSLPVIYAVECYITFIVTALVSYVNA